MSVPTRVDVVGVLGRCLDGWARCGIYVRSTTPDPRHARFYVARFVEHVKKFPGDAPWWHLHADGWRRSYGVPWHFVHGSQVKCPTFGSFTEAASFARDVEKRLGPLEMLGVGHV